MFREWKPREIIYYGILVTIVSFVFLIFVPRLQAEDSVPLIIVLLNRLGGKWVVFGFFFIAGLLLIAYGLKKSKGTA